MDRRLKEEIYRRLISDKNISISLKHFIIKKAMYDDAVFSFSESYGMITMHVLLETIQEMEYRFGDNNGHIIHRIIHEMREELEMRFEYKCVLDWSGTEKKY